jgi:hypothetical protein
MDDAIAIVVNRLGFGGLLPEHGHHQQEEQCRCEIDAAHAVPSVLSLVPFPFCLDTDDSVSTC